MGKNEKYVINTTFHIQFLRESQKVAIYTE